MSDVLTKKIENIFKELTIIDFEEIPDIDLYMDQLTTFMENKLKGHRRNNDDKIMTKTMINNYTKDKVLPVPNKKKYSIEQITMIIMIYHMKSVLSLGDIDTLFKSNKRLNNEDFYEIFTELQRMGINHLNTSVAAKIDEIKCLKQLEDLEKNEETAMLLLAVRLAVEAGISKHVSEKIIDKFFTKQKNS